MFKIKASFAALAILAGLIAACGESEADIAERAAREWVAQSVQDTSNVIAELVGGDVPAASRLAGGLLAGQIRDNVTWTYSTPRQRHEGRYDVTATARVELKLSLPLLGDKAYAVSVAFDLEVDTTDATVVGWSPNLPSATVRELG